MDLNSYTDFTGYYDKKGVPIFKGDLVKRYHFTTANRRKVWMYKKVMGLEGYPDRWCMISVEQLGVEKQLGFLYKDWLLDDDYSRLWEVIEGDCYNSLYDGTHTCFWERKRDFKRLLKASEGYEE